MRMVSDETLAKLGVVHNMGDAGYILFGPLGWLGREILSAGTLLFAVFAVGGQLLAADAALGSLSDNKLCVMWYTGEHSSIKNRSRTTPRILTSYMQAFSPSQPSSSASLER